MSSDRLDDPGHLCVILKPTARCNAGCRYCASHRASRSPDLELDGARELLSHLYAHARSRNVGSFNLLWHGGEPLLMGKEYYRALWSESRSLDDVRVGIALQSNLLAVDEEWVAVLRRYGVRVSSSVDPIDSTLRLLANGAPQYPVWLERAAMVCEGNVHLGVVFTASSTHAGHAGEIYSYFRNLQCLSERPISIRLNPVSPVGLAAADGTRSLAPTAEELGDLLVELWRRWEGDGRRFPFSPFEEWSSRGRTSCTFRGTCHRRFLAVDGELNVSNCGRSLDSGRTYGKCAGEGLPDYENTELWRALEAREGALLSGACKGCAWWDRCHGGCPTDSLATYGDLSRESPFCSAYQRVFESIKKGETGG